MPEENSGQEFQSKEPTNAYLREFEAKGITTTIPARFLDESFYLGTKPDKLTGLPVEHDEIRQSIVAKFTTAIREGKKWVCIYSDEDNLKAANNQGRAFGDAVITQGAATLCNAVAEILAPDTSAIATRQTDAADETVLWIIDPSDEELTALREKVHQLNRRRTNWEHPAFTFSSSIAIATSEDPERQAMQTETQQALQQDRIPFAYNMYNEVKQRADDDTKLLKIGKDLLRIPVGELTQVQGADAVQKILVNTLKDSRVSERVLNITYTLMRQEQILDFLQKGSSREELFAILGLPAAISGHFSPTQARRILYGKLVGKVLEDINPASNSDK